MNFHIFTIIICFLGFLAGRCDCQIDKPLIGPNGLNLDQKMSNRQEGYQENGIKFHNINISIFICPIQRFLTAVLF